MDVYELLSVGVAILLGLLGGRLSHRFKIPRVTGYMLIGLVFGPSVLGLLTSETLSDIHMINDIALGLILFAIGGKFELRHLKAMGSGQAAKGLGSEPAIYRNLGLALVPQAGVAIGMVLAVSQKYPDLGQTIGAVLLASIIVYEGIGPFLTRLALARAGDIHLQE